MRQHGGYLIAFVDKDEEEIKSGHDGSCHVDVLLEGEERKEEGKRGRRRERRRRAEGEKVEKEGRRRRREREEMLHA